MLESALEIEGNLEGDFESSSGKGKLGLADVKLEKQPWFLCCGGLMSDLCSSPTLIIADAEPERTVSIPRILKK